jgi:hypothetical protein
MLQARRRPPDRRAHLHRILFSIINFHRDTEAFCPSAGTGESNGSRKQQGPVWPYIADAVKSWANSPEGIHRHSHRQPRTADLPDLFTQLITDGRHTTASVYTRHLLCRRIAEPSTALNNFKRTAWPTTGCSRCPKPAPPGAHADSGCAAGLRSPEILRRVLA